MSMASSNIWAVLSNNNGTNILPLQECAVPRQSVAEIQSVTTIVITLLAKKTASLVNLCISSYILLIMMYKNTENRKTNQSNTCLLLLCLWECFHRCAQGKKTMMWRGIWQRATFRLFLGMSVNIYCIHYSGSPHKFYCFSILVWQTNFGLSHQSSYPDKG